MRNVVTASIAFAVLGMLVVERAAANDPESAPWEEAEGVPAWVTTVPEREGQVRVVDASQSNLLELAYGFLPDVTRRSVGLEVAWRLRPLLGKDADAAARAADAPAFVKKGWHLTPSKRGSENTPGAATYTAYVLWETPLEPILAAVTEAKRGEARTALARSEPLGLPAWDEVSAAPEWATAPAPKDGFVTVVVSETADRADVATTNAMVLAGQRIGGDVMLRVRRLLGPEGAWKVGNTAATWRTLRARAVAEAGERPAAWTLWDVPLEPLLEAAPAEQRDAARTAILAGPVRHR
jgi:hypothetical protein